MVGTATIFPEDMSLHYVMTDGKQTIDDIGWQVLNRVFSSVRI